ncbi:aspartate/glutamate racemase family protein [Corynebacterium terpenotabidum]|uniref:Glutamate racemase n=1 Tax=Corynebacterium terpenotabidum Y-11 TaxID=1200352 RepID=S4XH24_9CORY|nr:aspartate/glutamate racemase family protein [Corynebacterium terpenotabidum]AGP31851.1 glutamate racemase [Corynebacterium terpenotabidum Y-11]
MNTLTIGIVNVNTSAPMTQTIVDAARTVAAPDTTIIGVTPTIGPASVESHVETALSQVGVIDAVHRRHTAPVTADHPRIDAWILAGYGDTGREALQELVDVPVVDITEAAAVTAMALGDRYAVVTTLDRTVPMIHARLLTAGLAARCESVKGTGLGVLELEEDAARTDRLILDLAGQALDRGAEVICLGCGGMAGRARELTERLGAPVVDGVTAAVGMAESLVRQGLTTSRAGTYAPRSPKTLTGFEQLEVREKEMS